MLLSQGSTGRRYEAARDTSSIIVIDRQVLTRGCLVEVLKSEFPELDIIALPGAQELEEVKARPARLVVLNVESSALTDAPVLQELSDLKRAFPNTPVAIISQRDDDAVISQAAQRGVKCYLPTSLPLEIAVAALRLTLVGGVYYPRPIGHDRSAATEVIAVPSTRDGSPNGAGRPFDTGSHDFPPGSAGQPDVVGGLTRREVEVLAALQRGRSNKLIACELGMSENTVKVHIQRIMRKLRASNRTEAVLISQRRISGFAVPSDAVP